MRRIEWLNWRLRWGNPRTRLHDVRFFLTFEVYNLLCWLSHFRINHWLRPRSEIPAGKYLRVVRPAPFLIRLLDRRFPAGEESHSEYLPYTSESEEKLRRAEESFSVVEISYRLAAEVY